MSRIPAVLKLESLQESLRQIWQSLDPFLRSNPDMNGRKFLNCGNAVDSKEFVTLGQADKRYLVAQSEEGTGRRILGSAAEQWRLYHEVVLTASLPAAGTSMNGVVLIEDAGAGDRNLIIYAGGERFRIDGGVAF